MIKGTTSDYHLNCLNLHLISYCLSLIFSCRGLQLQRLPFLMCTPVCVHFHPPLPFHIFVPFRSVHSFVFVYQSRLFLSCRLNVLKQIYTINASLPLYAFLGAMFCIMCMLLYISICFCSVNGRLSSDPRTTSCCSSPRPLG